MQNRKKRSKLYNINPLELQAALDSSYTWSEVFIQLGYEKEDHKVTTLKAVISEQSVSVDKFKTNQLEHRTNLVNYITFKNLSYDELISRSNSRLTIKRYIINNNVLEYKCAIKECSNKGLHLNKKLSLHLDHIDGNGKNNEISNLRFLCPNCHSQTDTYGAKNKKHKKIISRIKKIENVANKTRTLKFKASKIELELLLKTKSLTKIGEMFNVSDNAIRKRCVKLGIDFKSISKFSKS